MNTFGFFMVGKFVFDRSSFIPGVIIHLKNLPVLAIFLTTIFTSAVNHSINTQYPMTFVRYNMPSVKLTPCKKKCVDTNLCR